VGILYDRSITMQTAQHL